MRYLRNDDRGTALVEYGLLVALIVLVALVAVQFFGVELNRLYQDSGTTLLNL